VSEMLNNIKMLKLNGMESWQVDRIMAQREKVEQIQKEHEQATPYYLLLWWVRHLLPPFTFAAAIYLGQRLNLSMITIAYGYFY